jgi:HAT1-interacting factor 1
MSTSNTGQSLPTVSEDVKSQASQLEEFLASAAKAYSQKDYAAAADLYAQASEIQASINSETSTENADTLYLYGRSLYQVGVGKSDVLGGKAADDNTKTKSQTSRKNGTDSATGEERVAAEVVQKVVESKDGTAKSEKGAESGHAANPLFQITGDENWDDSDDGDDAEEAASPEANGEAGDEEDEEDDLTAAWNILDLVRVLYTRKLTETTSQDSFGDAKGKGKASDDPPHIRHIKERLSDTHDLLAEISLEGEKFPAAVVDFRAALELKKELYPEESSLIAEAHYKLSLALEFAATTTSPDTQVPALADGGAEVSTNDQEAAAAEASHVDEAGREEAAVEMEAAIRSCQLRVAKEEASLSSVETSEADKKNIRDSVADVKEMIKEMEQRVCLLWSFSFDNEELLAC